jgi:hypothetical protein
VLYASRELNVGASQRRAFCIYQPEPFSRGGFAIPNSVFENSLRQFEEEEADI